MHDTRSSLAGQYLTLNADLPNVGPGPHTFHVEDWWDRVSGQSWAASNGNPAAMLYAMRIGMQGLPLDDDVLYGKVGAFGHLVHVSEFEKENTV